MWCLTLDRHNWREYCFTPRQRFFASRERGESQESTWTVPGQRCPGLIPEAPEPGRNGWWPITSSIVIQTLGA